MFEAMHGSAPRRAGQNLANPSGLLLGSVLMLVHIGQPEVAERVHNAWLRTIEDGIHTYDIYTVGSSSQKVGTREFASAVAARLGQKPNTLPPVSYSRIAAAPRKPLQSLTAAAAPRKELVGVDLYLEWPSRDCGELARALEKLGGEGLRLTMISNRGVMVWPEGMPETFCTDSFRCRFLSADGPPLTPLAVVGLLERAARAGLEVAMTENLRTFDGQPGFSLAQGQ
jgi:isocitrate dehydrogenase